MQVLYLMHSSTGSGVSAPRNCLTLYLTESFSLKHKKIWALKLSISFGQTIIKLSRDIFDQKPIRRTIKIGVRVSQILSFWTKNQSWHSQKLKSFRTEILHNYPQKIFEQTFSHSNCKMGDWNSMSYYTRLRSFQKCLHDL